MLPRPLRILVPLSTLVLVVALVLGALVWRAERVATAPALSCPTIVNLGEQERGTRATGRVTIANQGNADLLIYVMGASCACGGLERETPAGYAKVDRLTIAANESVELVARMAVNMPAGTAWRTAIELATNDPKRPRARIEFFIPVIKGGVVTMPASLDFGTVLVGSPVTGLLKIRDHAEYPRSVGKVVVTDPSRIRTRQIDPEKENGETPEVTLVHGRLIGLLKVEIDTRLPGIMNEELHIDTAGDRPARVHARVVGRIAAPVEAIPGEAIIPRISEGKEVYSSTSILRSFEGRPFAVEVASCPSGLAIQGIRPGLKAPEHEIEIALDLDAGRELRELAAKGAPAIVQFHCRFEGGIADLKLPVWCWERR